jgi:hypothetical protein
MDSNNPASITTQPVQDTTKNTKVDMLVDRPHLCACERGCAKCINCVLCIPQDVQRKEDFPTKCSQLLDFRVYYCTSGDEGCFFNGCFCGVVCFPISLVCKLVCQVPCVGYNICRNKCGGTKELDYIP